MGNELQIALLGPVQVDVDGIAASVRSRPQRVVLAELALEPGRVVSASTLIDALWPSEPPANASGNLQSYVSKLRRLVGTDRIVAEHGGYRLRVDEDAVDVGRAEKLAARATSVETPHERADVLREALSLWRGEPLADLADVLALEPERLRLSALRRELELRQIEALVDAGDHATALPTLMRISAQERHDEAIHRLVARALHGLGRSSQALGVAASFRRRIAEETGLEASSELGELEQRILADDPRLRSTGAEDRWRAELGTGATARPDPPRFSASPHGRVEELAQLGELLDGERLVTLTGPGGIGKTLLASVVADDRSDAEQVHFMPLASLSPRDHLPSVVASWLGLRTSGDQEAVRALQERLVGGDQLLVLDNCEHILLDVRRLAAHLLDNASGLRILATSRTPLGLTDEVVLRLHPFSATAEAARSLFVERAARVRPGWEPDTAEEATLHAVIEGLGGLPLAIELAAGRMGTLSLSDLAARLGDLDLLADGRPSNRHRTARAAINWSYRLLSPRTRRLLRWLSVFPAGVDLVTVEEITDSTDDHGNGASDLIALVEASLVEAHLTEPARYTMLEPIRAFADERLRDEGDHDDAFARRASWARRTAARIDEASRGPDESTADALLRREIANLRVAHGAALRDGDLDTAIAISIGLMRPATSRDLPEIWSWALSLVDHPDLPSHPRQAVAMGAGAEAAWLVGDLERGEELASAGLSLDPSCFPCLHALASARLFGGEHAAARDLWLEASRTSGSYLAQAGLAATYLGDTTGAEQILADATSWAIAEGSPGDLAVCHYATGELLGPEPTALGHYEEAIRLASSVGATFVAGISRVGLASTLATNGHHQRAIDEFVTLIDYWQRTGNQTQQWTTLRNVADLFDRLDNTSMARHIHAAASVAPAAPSTATSRRSPTATSPADLDSLTTAVLADLTALRRGP